MPPVRERIGYYIRQITKHVVSELTPPDRHSYLEARQYDILTEIARLRTEISEKTPDNSSLAGYKVFSQADEDGIIQALLNRLPQDALSRTAIEIGCGNGVENNTHLLLLQGYRVCWLDGDPHHIGRIRRELGLASEARGRLMLTEAFVTRENVAELIERFCTFLGTKEPDFFTLDVDGNDLHVLERAVPRFHPKVVCVEYNGKFPPPLKMSIRYNPQHQWGHDDYHGASLQAFCDLLSGYSLVCCNIIGTNAFFVRNDFRALFPDYPISVLFQPLRLHLRLLAAGHPPSLKWARDALYATGMID